MDLKEIRLWTALITPFKENLQVDWDSLKVLAQEQSEAGNGLLILGSTGEALNIELETKKEIIRFVLDLGLKTPIMAGIGGHDLPRCLSWAQWLEERQVDAYLMVTPIYAKPGIHGQIEWFTTLMDEVTKPVMLYNVPGRTGKELELEAVRSLKSHKNFWSIKEASGDVEVFKGYLEASGNSPVFCGDDGLFPAFANNGSCGLVSVAANVWPREASLYVAQSLRGNLQEKQIWEKAANALFSASNPVPAKRLLHLEKRISSPAVRPPLSVKDLSDDQELIQSNQAIKNWSQSQQ